MKALCKKHAEPGLWLDEAPVPKIKSSEILIRIKKTAICGTDLHIYNWDKWSQDTVKTPMIIGHEYYRFTLFMYKCSLFPGDCHEVELKNFVHKCISDLIWYVRFLEHNGHCIILIR